MRPPWASEITSLGPSSPRAWRPRRKSTQNGSASDGPRPRPIISRRPSVLAATAIIAATETILLPCPGLEVCGVKPETGPLAGLRAVEELVHPLIHILTQLGDGAFGQACEAHGLHQVVHLARGDAADPGLLHHSDQRLPGGLRGSRKPGKQLPCRRFGTLRFNVPTRVSSARSRYPLRHVARSALRSCRPAPIRPSTSASMISCSTCSARVRMKSP